MTLTTHAHTQAQAGMYCILTVLVSLLAGCVVWYVDVCLVCVCFPCQFVAWRWSAANQQRQTARAATSTQRPKGRNDTQTTQITRNER